MYKARWRDSLLRFGKPDLSGVWMHEVTTVEEVKRLIGHRFDEAVQVNGLGMEIGTQHKYQFDLLLDFKPEESPMRPEASSPESPRADLLSEPIKIVQAPRLCLRMTSVRSKCPHA